MLSQTLTALPSGKGTLAKFTPKGVEHKPIAAGEVKMMLVEPKGVVNTGDAGGEMRAAEDVWV